MLRLIFLVGSECPPGKGKRSSHPLSIAESMTVPGERVHVDLVGPMPIASINNSRYSLFCKDEFSTYTYVYFLKSKGETVMVLAKLICEYEVDKMNRIRGIQSDKATEFNNTKVETLFDIEHIAHETTAVRAPQENGLIEWEVQNIGNMARTSLLASDLPPELWEQAIETACYLRNRTE